MDIDRVSEIGSDLAESLYWDAAVERLYWIDAWRTRVYAFDPATRQTDCADLTAALAGLPIGSMSRDDREGMIGGIKNGFYRLDLKERQRAADGDRRDRPTFDQQIERRQVRSRRTILVCLGEY